MASKRLGERLGKRTEKRTGVNLGKKNKSSSKKRGY